MFINFWHPAEASGAITREPRKVTMLGMHFVMWRDEAGQATARNCLAGTNGLEISYKVTTGTNGLAWYRWVISIFCSTAGRQDI